MNQGFEPDESVENDDQQSPERESGEHCTVHINTVIPHDVSGDTFILSGVTGS